LKERSNLMQLRERESGYLPASAFMRTNRIVRFKRGYYFKSREKNLIGPFATESEARFELNLYIEIKGIEQEFECSSSCYVA
jgi:hypothetical protein